jgi:hypothetical protein
MSASVVQVAPTPRARSASMKDQAAGMTEPYVDACAARGCVSTRPSMPKKTIAGTSCMCW